MYVFVYARQIVNMSTSVVEALSRPASQSVFISVMRELFRSKTSCVSSGPNSPSVSSEASGWSGTSWS